MTYVYRPYPRRLYMGGVVLTDDPHATNSVVVQDAAGEAEARTKGYRKAHEPAESTGDNTEQFIKDVANEGRAVPPHDIDLVLTDSQWRDKAAALGVKVHHRAGAATIKDAIAKAGK